MSVFKKAVTACAVAGAGLMPAAWPAGSALAGTGTTVGQTGTPLGGHCKLVHYQLPRPGQGANREGAHHC
jgi:hypothetical protein